MLFHVQIWGVLGIFNSFFGPFSSRWLEALGYGGHGVSFLTALEWRGVRSTTMLGSPHPGISFNPNSIKVAQRCLSSMMYKKIQSKSWASTKSLLEFSSSICSWCGQSKRHAGIPSYHFMPRVLHWTCWYAMLPQLKRPKGPRHWRDGEAFWEWRRW